MGLATPLTICIGLLGMAEASLVRSREAMPLAYGNGRMPMMHRPRMMYGPSKTPQTLRIRSLDSAEKVGMKESRGELMRVRADSQGQQVEEKRLPWYFDVGTKGGALTVPAMTVVFPLVLYNVLQANGLSAERAGPLASFIYLFGGLILWTSTYLYRVGTKSMTYAQQLRDYEDAVMLKRLEEMSDDEIEQMLIDAQITAKKLDATMTEAERAALLEQ
eukprot:CAMPEP_0167758998 /NCGR_PEP_ID=MMETSP0110_2-20121227/10782_1 /TAXON_ID=629695 /ORGANISM="Gymnochlora sp., Strain CCMP2014" /LENGTH=217 /DNA_ID=CAMNT_0007645341 /DNA_START=1 /DNA_END=654 /DNA_ORIENTATION=-